jgi:hypothetical protein
VHHSVPSSLWPEHRPKCLHVRRVQAWSPLSLARCRLASASHCIAHSLCSHDFHPYRRPSSPSVLQTQVHSQQPLPRTSLLILDGFLIFDVSFTRVHLCNDWHVTPSFQSFAPPGVGHCVRLRTLLLSCFRLCHPKVLCFFVSCALLPIRGIYLTATCSNPAVTIIIVGLLYSRLTIISIISGMTRSARAAVAVLLRDPLRHSPTRVAFRRMKMAVYVVSC